jgi:transposase
MVKHVGPADCLPRLTGSLPLRDGPAVLPPRQRGKLARGAKDKEHAMSQTPNTAIAVIGIDIGKNSFHVVGHDARGAIVLRQKWSRGQVEARLSLATPAIQTSS